MSRDQVEDRLLAILDGAPEALEPDLRALLTVAPEHRELIRRTLGAVAELAAVHRNLFGSCAATSTGS